MTAAPATPDRRPRRRLAVVACMDARVDPAALLGLSLGDAHILRNAGGVVGEAELRALAISQRAMGTAEVAVIGHTDCGACGFDDEGFREALAAETGATPGWDDGVAFDDVEAGVRASVERVRSSPFLPHRDAVRGYVVDVATGELREVTS